jgi:peptidoglycan hydrolase CwlO-like protein
MTELAEILREMRNIQVQNSKIYTQLDENDAHIRSVYTVVYALQKDISNLTSELTSTRHEVAHLTEEVKRLRRL